MKTKLLQGLCLMLVIFSISCVTVKDQTVELAPTQEVVDPMLEEDEFNIDYEKFVLSNGLEVILHEDHSDPIVAVATVVHVGSNREKPGKTGFAHFFEHMSFNDSENVPVGANRKLIPEWGGNRNGGTWPDGTIYYEVVPKDAFDKILWIDSDRLGFMINTVTEAALEREKQVVKNEKRQRVDNNPYGYTNEVIRSNLYPKDHPYHWTVIGSLPDLQAATLEDVKEFYKEYYGANNASLVIAGDIDIAETKKKVEQWFGEIEAGPLVKPLPPMPVELTASKKLFFEDNFAKLPELRMVFPTVEDYHEDSYALSVLGQLLSRSKKSPFYNTIVEDKKLAPRVSTYQNSNELAGTFNIIVRANENVDLDEVYSSIQESFQKFETVGFSNDQLTRIKTELETERYEEIETVLDKAFNLVQDNEFAGNPTQIIEDAKRTKAVSREDVMRVYEKYIKDKHYIMTSFVPKGNQELMVEESEQAIVWEEEIKSEIENEEVGQGEEATYEKTVTKFDRSEPDFGEPPLFQMPEIWESTLDNGVGVYGIESKEVPLVSFNITINGGHLLDPVEQSGTASLMTDLLMEGTIKRTAADLEEAIGLLGADIRTSCSSEEIKISAKCLSRNFEATLALVEEILLEPRFDQAEFDRLKEALKTNLKGKEGNARSIASTVINKLLYGEDHIFGKPVSGTLETISTITLNEVKNCYSRLAAKEASFHIVGDINQDRVLKGLQSLNNRWQTTNDLLLPVYPLPQKRKSESLFFIDVPGAKQSVLAIGKLAVSAQDEEYDNLKFANEIIGSGSSGQLTQILRIEKGYTYGAYSFLRNTKITVPYIVFSSVRANATLPSLEIIEGLLKNYSAQFSEEQVEITKNKVLKTNTRAYESARSKLSILENISKYGKSANYLEESQEELINMQQTDFKSLINKYLQEKEMIYLIVGDAATQLEEVNKLGKGPAKVLDIHGNPIGR